MANGHPDAKPWTQIERLWDRGEIALETAKLCLEISPRRNRSTSQGSHYRNEAIVAARRAVLCFVQALAYSEGKYIETPKAIVRFVKTRLPARLDPGSRDAFFDLESLNAKADPLDSAPVSRTEAERAIRLAVQIMDVLFGIVWGAPPKQ